MGGVSATSPPIRTYIYKGTLSEFETGVRRLTRSDSYITYEITDTLGNINIGYTKRMSIFYVTNKRNVKYELKYEVVDSQMTVKLIMAYDPKNNIGGYSLKTTGDKELLIIFENEVLIKLKEKQHIVLKPDTSFWANFSIY